MIVFSGKPVQNCHYKNNSNNFSLSIDKHLRGKFMLKVEKGRYAQYKLIQLN